MSVREYIGARYVPLFSDPIQWDNANSYEPLTVVMNQGTSYVSKQSVPIGIDILNETYWLRWADYNAQLEEYIRQVQQYNARIQENTDDIAAINDKIGGSYTSESTVTDAIDAIDDKIGGSYTSESTVTDAIDAIDDKIGGSYTSESTVTDAIDEVDDKLSDYIATKNFIAGYGAAGANIYIDANDGDDENSGYWGHPVKTISRAFEIVNSNNTTDVYFHFISPGNFTIQNKIINGGQVHFMVDQALDSGSVTLNFDTLRAYNSYLHFSAQVADQFSVTFTNENHFDNCAMWCSKVAFTFNSAPNHNYCDFCFVDCEISTKVQIQLLQCRVKFTGTTTLTQLADFNNVLLFFRFCNVMFEGLLNMTFIGNTYHAMLRFDESFAIFEPSGIVVSKPSPLRYGLTFLRSVGIVDAEATNIIANHVSSDVLQGYYSIIQNKQASTIFS